MLSVKQKGFQLACMEVWGGNHQVDCEFELPSLSGWIHSVPLGPGTGGGDVYYLSVCNKGALSRIVLADVEGHGQAVSPMAETLHELVRKYINVWDQSDFARELNRSFLRGSAHVGFATMLVLGFYTVPWPTAGDQRRALSPPLVSRPGRALGVDVRSWSQIFVRHC